MRTRYSVLLVKRRNGAIEVFVCQGEPTLELAGRYSPKLNKLLCLEPIGDDFQQIIQLPEQPLSPLAVSAIRAYNYYAIEHGLEAAS